jgi:hypothetical protein
MTFTHNSTGAPHVHQPDDRLRRPDRAQARAPGLDCHCRVLSLEHVPRAIVSRDTLGLVKLVAEPRAAASSVRTSSATAPAT